MEGEARDCEFSVDRYGAILEKARTLNYEIVPFREFQGVHERPVLLLRHDLDHALEPSLDLAYVESEMNLQSTFFVQTACEFYNILAPAGRECLSRLTAMGHEVGLHYVADRYTGPTGRKNLRSDLRLLSDLSSQQIVSAAQHLPTDGALISLHPDVANEAYDARFVKAPMDYISDSLMSWRQAQPEELLDKLQSFQLLTHPEIWTEGCSNMPDLLQQLMRRDMLASKERYLALIDYYADLLATREERDRVFRELREQ